MSPPVPGKTWDDADSPDALGLAQRYEAAWRDPSHPRPDLAGFLPGNPADRSAATLALLRMDLALRIEAGEPVRVEWYRDRHPELTPEALVALLYEEFCLREEADDDPDPAEYDARFPDLAPQLREILDIHSLVAAGISTAPHEPLEIDTPFPEAGQTIAGFHLVEELGRGTFARVFLAEERLLSNRPVVLKVTRQESREPQLLAKLQHTNIVPVYSYRTDPVTQLHLLCMPYFGRVTLAQVLADPGFRGSKTGDDLAAVLGRHLPAALALTRGKVIRNQGFTRTIAQWGAWLAEALQHAHEVGILHRDIKPSNVLLTDDVRPMLLDFNLSSDPGAEVGGSSASRLGGTLAYMPPEQIEAFLGGSADQLDYRADLYSLGMVLYEALGGQPFPHAKDAPTAVEGVRGLLAARQAGFPGLRQILPQVPPALEAVVARCLAPKPADRYASAADLAADLQAVADDAPLRHAREPWPGRVVRWLRRHRRHLAVAVPAGLALTLFAVARVHAHADRVRFETEARQWFDRAEQAEARGELRAAADQFAWAARLAPNRSHLDDFRAEARRRRLVVIDTEQVRALANRFNLLAEDLRFQLLGFGGDRASASRDLAEAFRPLGVLQDADWTRRPDWQRLESAPRRHLFDEVDDLLFLWVWAAAQDPSADLELARRAVAYCDRALAFAEPKGPWRTLRAWWAARLSTTVDPPTVLDDPRSEASPRSCFQWSLVSDLLGDQDGTLAWLKRACQLRPDDYWAQFSLAEYQMRLGYDDEALKHFDIAVALRPRSPWAYYNRARIYGLRKGVWDRAIDDLDRAVANASRAGFEYGEARLERGKARLALGDLIGARADFDAVLAADPPRTLAHSARLDLARLDAKAGEFESARDTYNALLMENPDDPAARQGRAVLALRCGRPDEAEADLDRLLKTGGRSIDRAGLLTLRARARLALRRLDSAEDDAVEALALAPSPGRARLWARVRLALGKPLDVRLIEPDAWPTDAHLAADLRAAASQTIEAANLNDLVPSLAARSLVLAAPGKQADALASADLAVALAPGSADALAVRARVRHQSGDLPGALDDVTTGL
ncbi:MAG: protein kinase, partial [Isosphaeraceae bacterium]